MGISQLARPTNDGMMAPNTITSPVERCHLVEECRLNELHAWLEELCANDHSERAAEEEHCEREP
jgi:hypothetical protein